MGKNSSELWKLDACDSAALIRSREISSRDLVQAVLARIEAVDNKIHAYTEVRPEEALQAADAADSALAVGAELGPLHGVPVSIKLNVDQLGYATDRGVEAYKHNFAKGDNPVVQNLRASGAVLLGRTNAPAYLMRWFTDNELHGATHNPLNPDLTPGGSSGGASAAVAAGMGAIALGNDVAGSIRYPAYCCGIFGIKPSTGRIPSANATSAAAYPVAGQLMAVQGPLTRSVRDLELALRVMSRPAAGDPYFVPAKDYGDVMARRRAAVALPNASADPAVNQALEVAAFQLHEAGYEVERLDPPRFVEAGKVWAKISMGDILAQLQPLINANGDRFIRRAIALWREVLPPGDAHDTLQGLYERDSLLRAWLGFLETWQVSILPVSWQLPFAPGDDVKDAETTARILEAQAPLMAISALGLPAVSVPLGGTESVPCGVQIVGGQFREDLCLAAARVLEAAQPKRTPTLHPTYKSGGAR
ncbi:hypothetical protein APR50_27410 [Variovorax paradoxus]|jgi:amidase|uniref:amidase n=1 Tax=Variovorax paradoxus TaxID=34073 RepID=UPI0006E65F0E|nr:hypothetical protein APR52_36975 [Variovorax paradoxus]KPV02422.1 hypothetical protein APR50_27410 [Variovorax paradoxus]KPV03721.1 hypothetical protein APR49_25940 [Variovorax paradoxus]KPV18627.1 hypothetical protein APR51_23015 [Variovorax paradoxus]KPV29100.1 hypothetical protein APR48_23600 [Variovorax paradoxus]